QSPGRRRRPVEPPAGAGADPGPAPVPRPHHRPAGHPQQRPGRPAEGPAGRRRHHPAHLPAPTDVTVYELTGRGRALQPALTELLHWGRRYAPEPSPDAAAQPAWALLAAAGRPTALPAGQTCELRIGPEIFYLSSDAGALTVRRGPAPDGDAVVTMSADTLYSLVLGHTTVTDAVRHSTVDGDTGIAHRALEPL